MSRPEGGRAYRLIEGERWSSMSVIWFSRRAPSRGPDVAALWHIAPDASAAGRRLLGCAVGSWAASVRSGRLCHGDGPTEGGHRLRERSCCYLLRATPLRGRPPRLRRSSMRRAPPGPRYAALIQRSAVFRGGPASHFTPGNTTAPYEPTRSSSSVIMMHGARHRQNPQRPADDDCGTRNKQPPIPLARFWDAALGFWAKGGGRTAWSLTFYGDRIALTNLALSNRLTYAPA